MNERICASCLLSLIWVPSLLGDNGGELDGGAPVVDGFGSTGDAGDVDLLEDEGDLIEFAGVDDGAAGLREMKGLLDGDDGGVGELDGMVELLDPGGVGDEEIEDYAGEDLVGVGSGEELR